MSELTSPPILDSTAQRIATALENNNSEIGNMAALETQAKSSIVAAVNEVNGHVDNFAPAFDASLQYAKGDLRTYQGKLKRCKTAITTPHAYNATEWDDVTTSEVYARPRKLIATATASSDTLGTLLNKLNLSSFDINKFYEGEYIVSNSKTILHLLNVTSTELSLIRDIISGGASQQVVLRISSNSSAFRWEFATTGNIQLAQTDVSMTDGTVINIYEV